MVTIMNNYTLIRYGILIAAKELNIEPIDFTINQDGILKEKYLSSLYDPIDEFIILSEEWIDNATDAEILLVLFHEMRHHYQNLQIKFFDNCSKLELDEVIVKEWKREFDSYKKPYEVNQEEYIHQYIERDAVEFSRKLLNKVANIIKV